MPEDSRRAGRDHRAGRLAGDVVLNGVAGSRRARARRWPRCDAGRTLALANKESLVAGGPLVRAAARPGQLVPVDSEHSALRAVPARRAPPPRYAGWCSPPAADRSAGAAAPSWPTSPSSRRWPTRPGTWARSITINSATLVNKGLEVIEAHELFGVPYDRIEVVVHPQSVVHSMVEFVDGSTIAQASPPDMRLPIALGAGLAGAGARGGPGGGLDARRTPGSSLPLDEEAFPAVRAGQGGGAGGAVPPGGLQRRERGVCGGVHRRAGCRFSASSTPWRGCSPTPRIRRTGYASRMCSPPRRGPGARARDHRRQCGGVRGTQPDGRLRWSGSCCSPSASCSRSACTRRATCCTAKAFGMKATRYFVGFGPTLWSFRRGETEYGIKAIPARRLRQDRRDDAAGRRLDPEDEHRAMWRLPGLEAHHRDGRGLRGPFRARLRDLVGVFSFAPLNDFENLDTAAAAWSATVSECVKLSGRWIRAPGGRSPACPARTRPARPPRSACAPGTPSPRSAGGR